MITYDAFLQSLASGLIGIWSLTDASGPALDISGNGLNGTYDADAVKGGGAWAIGNQPIVSLVGNGAIGLPLAGVDALLNWQEYSVIIWVKMPVAKWADTTTYNILFLGSTGTTQRIHIRKNTIPGELAIITDTGTALLSVVEESVITPDWIQIAITNSKIANQMKGYLNRNQIGLTQTGLGTDDGSALATAALGAFDATGTAGVYGSIGYAALYHGTILTQAQIQSSYDFVAALYALPTRYIIGSGDSTWSGEGATTSKLVSNLGSGWAFAREMAQSGITSTQWKNGVGNWLGIDGEVARTSFDHDPAFIIIGIGKNDMSAMPSQSVFENNVSYCLSVFHAKWSHAKILIEIPWRVGQDTNANLIKSYMQNVIASHEYAFVGTDETGYFRNAELASPGSYSSDGTHIDTAAGTTARAALLQQVIASMTANSIGAPIAAASLLIPKNSASPVLSPRQVV